MSSFKTDYTVYLPSDSVGADCYKEIESVVKSYGTKAVVVGGKTAMEKSRDALIEGVKGTSIQIIDFVWYGGNATYENVDQIRSCPAVQEADMVFAVGGGRAVDACKVVCDQMGKPIFTFPTIASNCAGITAISVMYNSIYIRTLLINPHMHLHLRGWAKSLVSFKNFSFPRLNRFRVISTVKAKLPVP